MATRYLTVSKPAPKKKPVDLSACNTKVWGALGGTARWHGFHPCRNPIVAKTVGQDGSTLACYCRVHAPTAQPGLVVETLGGMKGGR